MIKTVALFFIAAWAASETYKDIIEKAYSLSLQKDRSQAVQILSNSIKKETKKTAAPKELYRALEQVSTIFFSEKAQQLYELGLSLKNTDLKVSLAKIKESLKLDPDNYQAIIAQIQAMIALNDCASAYEQGKKNLEENPYFEPLLLAVAQSAVCAGQLNSMAQLKPAGDSKKSALSIFWYANDIEYQYKQTNLNKAKEALAALKRQDTKYPEIDYWLWKLNSDNKAAQKYISNCKTISAKAYRKYANDPMLCRRVTEIESYLKKNSGAEI